MLSLTPDAGVKEAGKSGSEEQKVLVLYCRSRIGRSARMSYCPEYQRANPTGLSNWLPATNIPKSYLLPSCSCDTSQLKSVEPWCAVDPSDPSAYLLAFPAAVQVRSSSGSGSTSDLASTEYRQ